MKEGLIEQLKTQENPPRDDWNSIIFRIWINNEALLWHIPNDERGMSGENSAVPTGLFI